MASACYDMPSMALLRLLAVFLCIIASFIRADETNWDHNRHPDHALDKEIPLQHQQTQNGIDLPGEDTSQMLSHYNENTEVVPNTDVYSGAANNDNIQEYHTTQAGTENEEEAEQREEEGDDEELDAEEVSALRQERGIFVTNTISEIDRLTDESRNFDRYPLVVAIAYKPTCRQSTKLVELLEEAIPLMKAYLDSLQLPDGDGQMLDKWTLPLFCKIDVDKFLAQEEEKLAERVLFSLGVTSVPSLFFIQMLDTYAIENSDDTDDMNDDNGEEKKREDMKFYFLDYAGVQSTPAELSAGLWHYIYRLRLGNSHRYRRYPNQNHFQAKRDAKMKNSGLDHFADPPYTVVMDDVEELEGFLKSHGRGLFSRVTPALDPHWTTEENEAIQYIMGDNTLIEEMENSGDATADDPFLVVCQCQRSDSSPVRGGDESVEDHDLDDSNGVYYHFDEIARVLALRRDVLFVVLEKSCRMHPPLQNSDDRGQIFEIQDAGVAIFSLDDDWNLGRHQTWKPMIFSASSAINDDNVSSSDASTTWTEHQEKIIQSSLTEFIASRVTPSLFWLDRQQTAPIAFAGYNKVHAVLFVDMHHCDSSSSLDAFHKSARNAVHQLRSVCQRYRQSLGEVTNSKVGQPKNANHMTCIVVPSTDTRILTTFGVDIWTPLDHQATARRTQGNGDKPEPQNRRTDDGVDILPTLLITDQRGVGLKRYYLDQPHILNPTAISEFVDSFWSGELNNEYKSGGRSGGGDLDTASSTGTADRTMSRPPTNRYGVQELTAEYMTQWMAPSTTSDGNKYAEEHLLLLMYSPTCGHCKRIRIIWNKLSELIRSLGWDTFVHVAKLDVTKNELFLPGMAVRWLPDVYYVGPQQKDLNGSANRRLVQYDRVDGLGEGIGGVNDTIEIIQWLLDVANLDEDALLSALDGHEGEASEVPAPVDAQ